MHEWWSTQLIQQGCGPTVQYCVLGKCASVKLYVCTMYMHVCLSCLGMLIFCLECLYSLLRPQRALAVRPPLALLFFWMCMFEASLSIYVTLVILHMAPPECIILAYCMVQERILCIFHCSEAAVEEDLRYMLQPSRVYVGESVNVFQRGRFTSIFMTLTYQQTTCV